MLFAKNGIITSPIDRYLFLLSFQAFCLDFNLQKKNGLSFVFITVTIGSSKVISMNWEKPLSFTRRRMEKL